MTKDHTSRENRTMNLFEQFDQWVNTRVKLLLDWCYARYRLHTSHLMAIVGPIFCFLLWVAFFTSPDSGEKQILKTFSVAVFAIVYMLYHAYQFEREARTRQKNGVANPYQKAGLPVRKVILVVSALFLPLQISALLDALLGNAGILHSIAILADVMILVLTVVVFYLRNFDPPPKASTVTEGEENIP